METVPLSGRETVEVVDGVHLTQLVAAAEMSAQHVHFEPGASVPEHSHHHEQVGFVYRGTMVFEVGGEEFAVGPNESFAIPGDRPHAARNDGDDPVRGLDIFTPPRPNPDWAE